ncbi:MAG: hypothetical protein C4342_05475 [Armatimonadota bacterium]
MPRNRLFGLLGGVMLGLAQIFTPVRTVRPTPPEQGFTLPPDLNGCSLEDLLELGRAHPGTAALPEPAPPGLAIPGGRTRGVGGARGAGSLLREGQ